MELRSSWLQRLHRIRQDNHPEELSIADKVKKLKEDNKSCKICNSLRCKGLMFVCKKKDFSFIKPYNICEKFEPITIFQND